MGLSIQAIWTSSLGVYSGKLQIPYDAFEVTDAASDHLALHHLVASLFRGIGTGWTPRHCLPVARSLTSCGSARRGGLRGAWCGQTIRSHRRRRARR
jgi:hypothetical protein